MIAKRRKLIALDANKGEVNLEIFEDFYPNRAYFVYELLQNAEDAGATQVTFTLKRDRLICEHDRRRALSELPNKATMMDRRIFPSFTIQPARR